VGCGDAQVRLGGVCRRREFCDELGVQRVVACFAAQDLAVADVPDGPVDAEQRRARGDYKRRGVVGRRADGGDGLGRAAEFDAELF
jgi:hypothetical protein